MEKATRKSGFQEMSGDTRLLIACLEEVPAGGFIPYHELSGRIDRDVSREARHNLISARRILQREQRMVFDPVKGEGLKRLDDSGIVKTLDGCIGAIRRKVKRSLSKASCVDYANLDHEGRNHRNMQLAVIGAMAQMTRPESLKLVERAVEKDGSEINYTRTLDLFRGAGETDCK